MGAAARSAAAAVVFFGFSRYLLGAVGKWETCFWFSTFPSALVAGAVEMWESRLLLARFPGGSWKEWEACLWLSTLSTAPAFPQLTPAWFRGRTRFPARINKRTPGQVHSIQRCAGSVKLSSRRPARESSLELLAL